MKLKSLIPSKKKQIAKPSFIHLPDTYVSEETLKRVLELQGYILQKSLQPKK